MYEVIILNSASRQLKKFDKLVRNKIITVLERIAKNLISLPLNNKSENPII